MLISEHAAAAIAAAVRGCDAGDRDDGEHVQHIGEAAAEEFNRPPLRRRQLSAVQVPRVCGAWTIDHVLSRHECAALIAATEALGDSSTDESYSFWDGQGTGGDRDGDGSHAASAAFRDADTIETLQPRVAALIWRRMRGALASVSELPPAVVPPQAPPPLDVGEGAARGDGDGVKTRIAAYAVADAERVTDVDDDVGARNAPRCRPRRRAHDTEAFAATAGASTSATPGVPFVIGAAARDDAHWSREVACCERDRARWAPDGLNEHFLFSRYIGGGHFAPHTDGATIETLNRRSFFSVIIYLNDVHALGGVAADEATDPGDASKQPDGEERHLRGGGGGGGGGTRFYAAGAERAEALRLRPRNRRLSGLARGDADPAQGGNVYSGDPALVAAVVQPRAGRVLVFDQAY